MLWEAATAIAGGLLNINPYDQPAVQTGKEFTFALMGKQGYERQARGVSAFRAARREVHAYERHGSMLAGRSHRTMRHAVIMAGGSGTRLWPLVAAARPKQFLRLFDGEIAALSWPRERLRAGCSSRRISGSSLRAATSTRCGGTAGRAAREPHRRAGRSRHGQRHRPGGDCSCGAIRTRPWRVFTADHIIEPAEVFARRDAGRARRPPSRFPESLVTFGITPPSPHTGATGTCIAATACASPGCLPCGGVQGEAARRRAEQYRALAASTTGTAGCSCGGWRRFWRSLSGCCRRMPAFLAELAADWERVAGTSARAERFAQLAQDLDRLRRDGEDPQRAGGRDELRVEGPRVVDLGGFDAYAGRGGECGAGAAGADLWNAANNILVSESEHLVVALGVSDLVVLNGWCTSTSSTTKQPLSGKVPAWTPRRSRQRSSCFQQLLP